MSVTAIAGADTSLLYLECQGVVGYLFDDSETVYYSHHPAEMMQKPSLGFDYLHKVASKDRDWGTLALQARVAYDPAEHNNIDLQIYNAYIKTKQRPGDIWVGHNRPAFGMSAYLDSHALLMQPLSMEGFGPERAWGY